MAPSLYRIARRYFPSTRVTIAVSLLATLHGFAAIVTWDGGSPTSSNWTAAGNWAGDVPPQANDALVFDGATRPTPVNDFPADTLFDSLRFATTAASFTLTGNSAVLNAGITNDSPAPQTVNLPVGLNSTHTIHVVAGGALTMGGVISGAGSLVKVGDGPLFFGAANTFTGDTILDGGTVVYAVDNGIGNLVFGASAAVPISTIPSASDLSTANLTAASLNISVNSSGSNTVTIGAGKTFTINGPVAIGPNTSGQAVSGVVTRLDVIGSDGNLVVNTTGNFAVGLPRLNADTGNDPFTTVDLSALKSFTFDAGTSAGELRVGGGNSRGILLLANASNAITAAIVHVSNSAVTSGAGGNNNGGVSRLGLGSGTNVINADTVNVGGGKSAGIFDFQSSTGTVMLAGRAGGLVNITLGNQNSATGSNTVTQFALAGHTANVQAGTVVVGRLGGATGGTGAAAITFDTGEFNVASLQLAVNASGTAANGAAGSFTLGTDSASTGVLNVTAEFFLANRTNTAQLTSPANGTFTINGGTANVNADIVDASTSGDASTRTTVINLLGGKLNMMGHAIGSDTARISSVIFPDAGQSATLANLGGSGINGAGLTLDNTGTLIVEGANAYTGPTTIHHGTLIVTGTLDGTTSLALAEGTLRLGASNRIADAATLSLTTGTFDSAGFNETLGAMTLGGFAGLELGSGSSVLHFADSSATTWTGLLSIFHWSGSPAGSGLDQIFFGNNAAALTPSQLALIQFIDPFGAGSGNTGARLLPTGELVAIPEPSSFLCLLGASAIFAVRRRRKSGPRATPQKINGADNLSMLALQFFPATPRA
jgi:autotransporter-associated beta strand protein